MWIFSRSCGDSNLPHLCGLFIYPSLMTPQYKTAVAYRVFFADLVPAFLVIVVVHFPRTQNSSAHILLSHCTALQSNGTWVNKSRNSGERIHASAVTETAASNLFN